jgi:chemotaxis protein CheD
VGVRNIIACKDILRRMNISLKAEDTGGTFGRTIELDTSNGALTIKTIGHGEKKL